MDLLQVQDVLQKIKNNLETFQEIHKQTDFKTTLNYVHQLERTIMREINKEQLSNEAKPRAKPSQPKPSHEPSQPKRSQQKLISGSSFFKLFILF